MKTQLCYPACRQVSTTWIHFIHLIACNSTQQKLNSCGLVELVLNSTWPSFHCLPAVKAWINFKNATMTHATLNQRGPTYGSYFSKIVKFNSEKSERQQMRSSKLQLTQLLSLGDEPSSGSVLSPSAVQKFGTRFLLTPGTLILLQLFVKPSKLAFSFPTDIVMHHWPNCCRSVLL